MRIRHIQYLLILFLCSCGNGSNTSTDSNLKHTFLKEFNLVNPGIRGVWKSFGNGYILDANEDSISLYSYTKNYCYQDHNQYLTELLNSTALFSESNDTLKIFLHDFGEKTQRLQTSNNFVRINQLPSNCLELSQSQNGDPEFLFDLFLETLESNYAFSAERNIDWSNTRAKYQPQITDKTNLDSLLQMMGEIVTLTKDQHTKIIAKDGRQLQYSVTPSAEKVWRSFKAQDQINNVDAYFDLFFETNYRNISDSLLGGEGHKVANGKIEWGLINEKIGYINIHSLTGFASNDLQRKQHLDTLNYHISKAVNALDHTDALILDVSFNFGGYDAAGLTIAGYFTDIPVLAYSQYNFYDGVFYKGGDQYIYPSESNNYTKPVYLLTTDISRSAAETFAMQMKVLPHVTLAGTPSLGILSGMLGKNIGDFYLTCSNEKYVSPEGKSYEVNGVEVDIPIEVFHHGDVFNGHKSAVRKIVDIIESTIAD